MQAQNNLLNRILNRPDINVPHNEARPSDASATSMDEIDDVDSDILSSQLHSKQTYSKP